MESTSAKRLRSFSGRTPRPQHESDYEAWWSGVDLLGKDPAVSDLQHSRKILESLLPPAGHMMTHLMPETPPNTYLQILDSAYGTVQDGDELFVKFMELFQDAGEKPSAYWIGVCYINSAVATGITCSYQNSSSNSASPIPHLLLSCYCCSVQKRIERLLRLSV